MTRLILCAGLNRSGSTWQINAVKELLQEADSELPVHNCWIGDYDPKHVAAIHLVKVHRFSDAAELDPLHVLSSYRDLRSVAGSLVRMGWSTVEWHHVRNYLDHYIEDAASWEARADLVMVYERLIEQPLRTLDELALSLGVALDGARLRLVCDRIEALAPNKADPAGNLISADRRTLLHDGHIGDRTNVSAAARLPASLIADIEIRYGDWLVAHGYPLTDRGD